MPADIERLKHRLHSIPEEIKRIVQPILQAAGNQLAADIKAHTPVGHDASHGNPPGALRDSIVMTPGGEKTPSHSAGGSKKVRANAVMVTVGNEHVRYAQFVEYGTS